MAHVAADGPLGLEGSWTFTSQEPGATVVNALGAHNRALDSWVKLDRISGIHGLGDADDHRAPRSGAIGENSYPGASRGKTVVWEGRVCGKSLQHLRQLQATMRRVFAESRQSQRIFCTTAKDGVGYFQGGRVIQYDCDDEQQFDMRRLPTPWQRSFILAIRLDDPRWLWGAVTSVAGNADAATAVFANAGNAPADLGFIVRGAIDATLTVENLTTGRKLVFEDLPIAGGQRLVISWSQRAAHRPTPAEPDNNPNTDMMPYLSEADSDWWDALVPGAIPGNNSIKVTGCDGTWDVTGRASAW